jgi:hypothetical protein
MSDSNSLIQIIDKPNPQINTNHKLKPTDSTESEYIISVSYSKNYSDMMGKIISSINSYTENSNNGTICDYSDYKYPYFTESDTIDYIPKLDVDSEIIDKDQLIQIHQSLPAYLRFNNFTLLYSTMRNGTSLQTFYNLVAGKSKYIILIKDDLNYVFGGFIDEEISNKNKFYGTGESFVFTFKNNSRIQKYEGQSDNTYYVYTDDEIIAMGLTEERFSICIRDDFLKGSSRPSKTYKNISLSSKEEFFIKKFEVWTIEK